MIIFCQTHKTNTHIQQTECLTWCRDGPEHCPEQNSQGHKDEMEKTNHSSFVLRKSGYNHIFPRTNMVPASMRDCPDGAVGSVHPLGWVQNNLLAKCFTYLIEKTNPTAERHCNHLRWSLQPRS